MAFLARLSRQCVMMCVSCKSAQSRQLSSNHLAQKVRFISSSLALRQSDSPQKKYQEALAALSGKILPPWEVEHDPLVDIDSAIKGRSSHEITLLGNQYYQGFGLPKNQDLAIQLWQKAASRGDLNAKYSFAMAIHKGEAPLPSPPAPLPGVPPSASGTGAWTRERAAAALLEEVVAAGGVEGDAPPPAAGGGAAAGLAAHALAGLLSAGGRGGVPADDRRALRLLQAAAGRGVVPALKAAADLALAGRGRPRDAALARRWYEVGAEAGDPACLLALSGLHARGEGGAAGGAAEARALLRRAAAAGHPRAMHNLGAALLQEAGGEDARGSSRGGAAAAAEAAGWFRKAAEKGFAPSMTNLGHLHGKGLGVERSEAQAEAWHGAALAAEEAAAARGRQGREEEGKG